MQQPYSWIIGNHVGNSAHHRREHDHVCSHVPYRCRLSMPMRGVNVPGLLFVGIREHVPAHALSATHGHHRTIAIQIAVDAEEVMKVVDARI